MVANKNCRCSAVSFRSAFPLHFHSKQQSATSSTTGRHSPTTSAPQTPTEKFAPGSKVHHGRETPCGAVIGDGQENALPAQASSNTTTSVAKNVSSKSGNPPGSPPATFRLAVPSIDSLAKFSYFLALLVVASEEEQAPSTTEREREALAELLQARRVSHSIDIHV